jgi:hypothetical protein
MEPQRRPRPDMGCRAIGWIFILEKKKLQDGENYIMRRFINRTLR